MGVPRRPIAFWLKLGSPSMPLADIEHLRFEDTDYFQYWTAVVLTPPGLARAAFANIVLRPDGLLVDHITPPVALGALSDLQLPDPCALYGAEPNVTYCLNGLAPLAPRQDGVLFGMRAAFPRLVVSPEDAASPGTSHPAFRLGSPTEFLDGPHPLAICVPDRLVPLRSGSMLRGQPAPDDAFVEALRFLARGLDDSPMLLDHYLLQSVAALGAGLDPPPDLHAVIGIWRPPHMVAVALPPSPATLVISLDVVGSDMPTSSGFIRGRLPSGWILFQRRAPALFPYVLNDYLDFVRLATGHLGPLHLVAGPVATALTNPFYHSDLPQSLDSPFVPLEDAPAPPLVEF